MQNYNNAKWIADKSPDGKTIYNPKDNIRVEINGICSHVPVDLANKDYVDLMKQVDAGELTIEDAD